MLRLGLAVEMVVTSEFLFKLDSRPGKNSWLSLDIRLKVRGRVEVKVEESSEIRASVKIQMPASMWVWLLVFCLRSKLGLGVRSVEG